MAFCLNCKCEVLVQKFCTVRLCCELCVIVAVVWLTVEYTDICSSICCWMTTMSVSEESIKVTKEGWLWKRGKQVICVTMLFPLLSHCSEQSTAYTLYYCWFPICSTGLMNLHQQFMQRWWRMFFVWKLRDYLLNFDYVTFFLMQNLSCNFSFFVKTIVYYYLDNSNVPVT